MQNLDLLLLLPDSVDHTIDMRFVAVEQMPELFALRGSGASIRMFFERQQRLRKTSIPAERSGRFARADVLVNDGKVMLGTSRDSNEICDAWIRTRQGTPEWGAFDVS